MITRDLNLPLNNYRKRAEDPENNFNWFYQQLFEKAKECESDSTSTMTEEMKRQCEELLGKAKELPTPLIASLETGEMKEQREVGNEKELKSQPTLTTSTVIEETTE